MRGTRRGVAGVLLVAALLGGERAARGDGSSGWTSTDAVAKERQEEFEELKKKDTLQSVKRRLEILDSLQFAGCPTAQRFLLALLKKSSAPADERLYALLSLVKTSDASTVDEILAALVREKDPTLWEAFGLAFGERPSPAFQAWLAGPALGSAHAETLAAALDGIAYSRTPDPKHAARLAALHAKNARTPARADLAYRALRALARANAAEARAPLLEAVRSPQWQVRLAAAEAVPALEPFDAEAEAATRALFQDVEPMVVRTAVAQAGLSRRQGLVPALVPMLSDPRGRTRQVVAAALRQATGQSLGRDPRAWAAWLEKRDPGTPDTTTLPSYHGLPVESDRVVFLVDASSSMTWPWSQPTHRIDVARAELASVLARLGPETTFNVLVFADAVAAWKKAEVPATPENVRAATAWVEKATAEPSGDTHLYEALEAAFANDPQFDTVYLLTDGNPLHGRYWTTAGLVASVRAWTRYRRTPVHAIGLSLADEDRGRPNLTEDLSVMAAVLRGLAGATGGEFREVLRVPETK